MTLYTKSGVNDSPYCSRSPSLSLNLNFSTEAAESTTRYSRMHIILEFVRAGKVFHIQNTYMASIKGVSLLKLYADRLLT